MYHPTSSQSEDVIPSVALEGVARVDDDRRPSSDVGEIERLVIGGDDGTVDPVRQRLIQRHRVELDRLLRELRHVRITVAEYGPALL